MKRLKDYLHLYPYCELDTVDGKGIFLGYYYPIVWTEEGNIEPNGVNVLFTEGSLKNKVYVMNFNQITPRFCHLSDMTEEEKQEYRKVAKLSMKGENLLPNIKSSELTNEYFNSANPEIVRWLLSKHFDIFELIEAELAIDKTTLK